RRLAPGAADAHPPRRRGLYALLLVRAHEALVPPHGRVHDPEPSLQRLRRLHEPRADDRHARVRRHVGLLRGGDAHEPDRRRARDRSARAPAEAREPDRRHDAESRRAEGSLDGPRRARGRRPDRTRARPGVQLDEQRAPFGRAAPRAPAGPATLDERRRCRMKHRGRGISTIEYPTGMNQNGDPSQAWVKLKPDGRVDVFAGTVDIGQGSRTVHTQIVADALGVPYDWVTMDNSNSDSSAICTGSFASRGTFIGGNAVRYAAEKVRERVLEIAGKELEIHPSDLEIADGEVLARGAPDRKISVADVAGAATWTYGELIS